MSVTHPNEAVNEGDPSTNHYNRATLTGFPVCGPPDLAAALLARPFRPLYFSATV